MYEDPVVFYDPAGHFIRLYWLQWSGGPENTGSDSIFDRRRRAVLTPGAKASRQCSMFTRKRVNNAVYEALKLLDSAIIDAVESIES